MIKYEVTGIANKIGLVEVETTSLRKALKVHKKSKKWAMFSISLDDVMLYHEELGEIKINKIEDYERKFTDNVNDLKKYCSRQDANLFANKLALISILAGDN